MDLKPKNLLKRVLRLARSEIVRRGRLGPTALASAGQGIALAPVERDAGRAEPPAARPPAAEAEPAVRGLEVAHRPDGGALILRWSITAEDVARAGALVDGQAVLCLRVVSFTKVRDDVLREVQDRPGIDLVGEFEISEPPQRAIVSLGVRVGDRFVSISHHVV